VRINFFKAFLLLAAVAVSSYANAGIIKIADWHDANGNDTSGLRQSAFDSSVFFAVAKDINITESDTYEVADGWHIASFSEYVLRYAAAINPENSDVHFNILGWQYYTSKSGAGNQALFAFSDNFDDSQTNRACHAAKKESACTKASKTEEWADFLNGDYKHYFAGLVVIKDGSKEWMAVSVPEPSTFILFVLGIMGLAMCRFKKQV